MSNFRLSGIDGRTYSLALYQDKAPAVVLVFMNQQVPICQKYVDRLRAVQRDFEVRFIRLIAVDTGGNTLEQMAQFAFQNNFNFPYTQDPDGTVAKVYSVTSVPCVVVVRPTDGQILYQGAIDDSPTEALKAKKAYLRRALTEICKADPMPYEVCVAQPGAV